MNAVEALQRFARFQAARASTEFLDVDVADDLSEASTHPSSSKQFLVSLSLISMAVRGSAHSASADFEPAPDEAPASDFDVLDKLRSPNGQIERQITALRRGGGLLCREGLAERLDFLMSALEEEGEIWADDSPHSLRQMLLFLRAKPELRCPMVTITPSRTFRAQWQAGGNRHLALDFLPDGQVRFVVFSPDPRHPDRVQRVSGIVGRMDVIRAVEPYKVLRWMTDAGA
ncbi:MAG: hypothetical protein K0Q60_2797 [Microvirga sp.]|jgi:hypothetical protein|nr:hypothetical protein [Microvirga sp.]